MGAPALLAKIMMAKKITLVKKSLECSLTCIVIKKSTFDFFISSRTIFWDDILGRKFYMIQVHYSKVWTWSWDLSKTLIYTNQKQSHIFCHNIPKYHPGGDEKGSIEKPAPPFKTDTIEKVASKVFQKFIVYKQIGKDNSSQNKKYTFKMQLTLHLQLWWKGLLPWHLVSEEVLTPPRNNKMDLVNVLVLKRKTNTRSSLVKTKDQKFYILFSFIDISKYGFHKFVQQA